MEKQWHAAGAPSLASALRPVLTLKTRVIRLRHVPAGTPVSYGGTYHTPQATCLATLAAGYGDGLSVALSNRGAVLLDGRLCPDCGARLHGSARRGLPRWSRHTGRRYGRPHRAARRSVHHGRGCSGGQRQHQLRGRYPRCCPACPGSITAATRPPAHFTRPTAPRYLHSPRPPSLRAASRNPDRPGGHEWRWIPASLGVNRASTRLISAASALALSPPVLARRPAGR